MPAYTRDPRTLRGVRSNALAVRPDYWTASSAFVPTGRWVLLSPVPLGRYLRRQGFPRHHSQPYAGSYAYVYRNWSEAMEAARHVVRQLAPSGGITPGLLPENLRVPGILSGGKPRVYVEAPCTCGQMHKDPSHRCLVHPDVRPRTFDERMAFEQAWDRRVQDDREASAERKAAAAMDRQMLMGEDLPVRRSYTPRHMGAAQRVPYPVAMRETKMPTGGHFTMHSLIGDSNGEPVCICGFDPARQTPAAFSRDQAIRMVSAHMGAGQ